MNPDDIKKTLQTTVYHHPVVKIVSIGATAKQAADIMINEGVEDVIFVHYEFKSDFDAVTVRS